MEEEIRTYDKGFTLERIKKYTTDVFSAFIDGIAKYDISALYKYVDQSIFDRYMEIINGYKNMKLKRHFTDLSYKSVMVNSYYASQNEIRIKVLLITKYKDYLTYEDGSIVDESTPKIIEKGHYITFSRNLSDLSSKYIIVEMDAI